MRLPLGDAIVGLFADLPYENWNDAAPRQFLREFQRHSCIAATLARAIETKFASNAVIACISVSQKIKINS